MGAPHDTHSDRLDFHIASGDYFGTLATIMGLMADSLSTNAEGARQRCIRTLHELQEDLSYLQDSHTIVPKD